MNASRRIFFTGLISVGLLGCIADASPETEAPSGDARAAGLTACESAGAHVLQCLGVAPVGFAELCTDDIARAILSVPCQTLREDPQATQANLFGDGLLDDSCFFNFECAEGLVCRPYYWDSSFRHCSELGMQKRESEPGEYCGDFCDDDSDCVSGLYCLSYRVGNRHGMCLGLYNQPGVDEACQ